jgi:4-alpha-glucanotransferase
MSIEETNIYSNRQTSGEKHMLNRRSSGLLMHISSLPSRYGIGDLGWSSLDFIDFLAKAGQGCWQFLPTGPSDPIYGCSPYMGLSAAAGNPLLISPDMLQEDGFLLVEDIGACPTFSEYLVDFNLVIGFKKGLLDKAYERFKRHTDKKEFDAFCKEEASWLEDYSLFMGLREKYDFKPWNQWPLPLAKREKKALVEEAWTLFDRFEYFKFEQFCFYKQWKRVRSYADQKGISLVGDIPIYVSYDSADVWANQDCFELHKNTLLPTCVAGVPPDYFSETGQRWGNPLYKWIKNKKKNSAPYTWWDKRFRQTAKMLDIVRIDHFRGFESYYEIPAAEETAVNGQWKKGPGGQFFKEMKSATKNLTIIAEDLGLITPEVEKLRDKLGLPGMKILQFAFDSDSHNSYLPHNYSTTNCVVYTGTHDNNTTLGWYLGNETSQTSKLRVDRYANAQADGQMHWDLIRLAFSSIAALAVIPMQDVLGFGEDCRMNKPGTIKGNWRWRCAARFLNDDVCARLRSETEFYGRLTSETKAKGPV